MESKQDRKQGQIERIKDLIQIEGLLTLGNLLGIGVGTLIWGFGEPLVGGWIAMYSGSRFMRNLRVMVDPEVRRRMAIYYFEPKVLGYSIPTSRKELSSYPRRIGAEFTWSTYSELEPFFKKKDNSVYLFHFKLAQYTKDLYSAHHFRFGVLNSLIGMAFPPYMALRGIHLLFRPVEPHDLKKVEKPVYVDPLTLTRGMLVIGSMGTGKSVFLKNLLAQMPAKRAVINDVKGEYVESFYDPERDIIFNPYDERSKLWAFLADVKRNPALADTIATAIAGQVSQEKDFWISASAKLLKDAMLYAVGTDTGIQGMIDFITAYNTRAVERNDRTAMSVYATLQPVLDALELYAWLERKYVERGQIEKFFSVYDFSEAEGKRLFLLNDPAHAKAIAPIFNAFVSALLSVLLSRPDTKEDFTLFLLDEFLNFNIPEDVLLPTFTISRSKGIQLVFATQFLPDTQTTQHRASQLVLASRAITVIFRTLDEKTLNILENVYGEVEFISISQSESYTTSSSYTSGKGGFQRTSGTSETTTETKQRATARLLNRTQILGIPQYHAIVHLAEPFRLFLAKVEDFYFSEERRNPAFIQLDTSEFLKWKYEKLMTEMSHE